MRQVGKVLLIGTSVHFMPSNKDFSDHFEKLLNPVENTVRIAVSQVYIPVLDDPINPREVLDEIRKINPTKAPGNDGIPPGIVKWLPDEWILLLTDIVNSVFHGVYPVSLATIN